MCTFLDANSHTMDKLYIYYFKNGNKIHENFIPLAIMVIAIATVIGVSTTDKHMYHLYFYGFASFYFDTTIGANYNPRSSHDSHPEGD